MPTIISHAVYAQKFVERHGISDPNSFYVIGSLVPDTRNLSALKREVTHVSLQDQQAAWDIVKNQIVCLQPEFEADVNLFRKGFLFHNYFDIWWNQHNPIADQDWFLATAMKLNDDQLYYSQLTDPHNIMKNLRVVPEKLSITGVPQKDLIEWLNRILEVLSEPPNTQIQLEQTRKWGFADEAGMEKIEEAFSKVATSPEEEPTARLGNFLMEKPPALLLTLDESHPQYHAEWN